jgi:hypothetical protein
MQGINKDCYDNGLRRKPECDTEENGGRYRVMNLRDYLTYQTSLNPGIEIKKSTIGGKEYLHLFRSCEETDTSIIDSRGTYDDEWNKLKTGTRRSTFPFIHMIEKVASERMGWEPGVGINVGLQESVSKAYLSGRITSDGLNKLHKSKPHIFPSSKASDYTYMQLMSVSSYGKAYIYELLVEISDSIIVCVIIKDCEWNQITCDKKTSDNFHLIGHMEAHSEMNILAKCPYIIHKRTLYKGNDDGIVPIARAEILDVTKEASNYRNKYLKYKNKYLELKKSLSNV